MLTCWTRENRLRHTALRLVWSSWVLCLILSLRSGRAFHLVMLDGKSPLSGAKIAIISQIAPRSPWAVLTHPNYCSPRCPQCDWEGVCYSTWPIGSHTTTFLSLLIPMRNILDDRQPVAVAHGLKPPTWRATLWNLNHAQPTNLGGGVLSQSDYPFEQNET